MSTPDSYSIVVARTLKQRSGADKIERQIDHLVTRGLKGARGKGWRCKRKCLGMEPENGVWRFSYRLTFEWVARRPETAQRRWQEIKSVIADTGRNARYAEPWIIVLEERGEESTPATSAAAVIELIQEVPSIAAKKPAQPPRVEVHYNDDAVQKITVPIEEVRSWNDLAIPDGFLGSNSEQVLAHHKNWGHLYGLGAQIRILWSAIQHAQETNGACRKHVVLYGPPGCGKSSLITALEQELGHGAFLKLDATSTTKAGLEQLIFSEESLKIIPPIVLMEEIEKADENALKIWLGALDDRGEVRKVNKHMAQVRKLQVLFIGTVNNKVKFDGMMGAGDGRPGALSSRCVTQIYCPRPNESILRQILLREVQRFGGKAAWVEPALQLAKTLEITDPRVVQGYLAGGDRLLDGSYQKDWFSVNRSEK